MPKVHSWKHRFSSECLSILHDQAFGAKNPTYTTVLQLDRKLRAFPVPPVLQVAGFGNSEPREGGFPETVMLTMQRHIVLAIRETSVSSLVTFLCYCLLTKYFFIKLQTFFTYIEVSLRVLLVITRRILLAVRMEHLLLQHIVVLDHSSR